MSSAAMPPAVSADDTALALSAAVEWRLPPCWRGLRPPTSTSTMSGAAFASPTPETVMPMIISRSPAVEPIQPAQGELDLERDGHRRRSGLDWSLHCTVFGRLGGVGVGIGHAHGLGDRGCLPETLSGQLGKLVGLGQCVVPRRLSGGGDQFVVVLDAEREPVDYDVVATSDGRRVQDCPVLSRSLILALTVLVTR